MPSYLVETFLPRGVAGERPARERRARYAAEELTRQGTRVRFDRTIHVPEDEICFFVFDAQSARARPVPCRRGHLVRKGLSNMQTKRTRTRTLLVIVAMATSLAATAASALGS